MSLFLVLSFGVDVMQPLFIYFYFSGINEPILIKNSRNQITHRSRKGKNPHVAYKYSYIKKWNV